MVAITHRIGEARVALIPLGTHNEDRVWRAAKAASETLGDAARVVEEQTAALRLAETFIAGFEDDGMQEGVADLLGEVRAAIAKAEGGA